MLVEGGSSKDYGCPDGLCPYSNLDTGIVKCYPCPTKQVTVSGSACPVGFITSRCHYVLVGKGLGIDDQSGTPLAYTSTGCWVERAQL